MASPPSSPRAGPSSYVQPRPSTGSSGGGRRKVSFEDEVTRPTTSSSAPLPSSAVVDNSSDKWSTRAIRAVPRAKPTNNQSTPTTNSKRPSSASSRQSASSLAAYTSRMALPSFFPMFDSKPSTPPATATVASSSSNSPSSPHSPTSPGNDTTTNNEPSSPDTPSPTDGRRPIVRLLPIAPAPRPPSTSRSMLKGEHVGTLSHSGGGSGRSGPHYHARVRSTDHSTILPSYKETASRPPSMGSALHAAPPTEVPLPPSPVPPVPPLPPLALPLPTSAPAPSSPATVITSITSVYARTEISSSSEEESARVERCLRKSQPQSILFDIRAARGLGPPGSRPTTASTTATGTGTDTASLSFHPFATNAPIWIPPSAGYSMTIPVPHSLESSPITVTSPRNPHHRPPPPPPTSMTRPRSPAVGTRSPPQSVRSALSPLRASHGADVFGDGAVGVEVVSHDDDRDDRKDVQLVDDEKEEQDGTGKGMGERERERMARARRLFMLGFVFPPLWAYGTLSLCFSTPDHEHTSFKHFDDLDRESDDTACLVIHSPLRSSTGHGDLVWARRSGVAFAVFVVSVVVVLSVLLGTR